MILVNSSVWIEHVRAGADERLNELLERGDVLTHPFVIGEIALGHVRRREAMLAALELLEQVEVCDDDEVLDFIHRHRLVGSGIGYIDAHLLAATKLTDDCSFWTLDRRFRDVASRLGLAADGP